MAGSDMMANLFGADSDEEEVEEYEGTRPMDEDADGNQGEEDDEEEYAQRRESDEEDNDKDAEAMSDAEGDKEDDEDQEANFEDRDAAGDEAQEERDELEDDIDADNEYDRSQRRVVKERPVGPPIELEIPMQPPPGQSEQMNVVKVSNIMDIEMKPFDPDTYEAQDMYIKDESGQTQRVKLDENVVRWRYVKNRDGTTEMESNTRFVKWNDGSMQLFIGSEVLNIAVQQTKGDQSHLFLRHKGGVLQSQGRLINKMKFMPSSLNSKSHKLLTALVDKKHKKVFKVKKVVTIVDPDKEKEEQERAVEARNKTKSELVRKQDRNMRKYAPPERRLPAQRMSPSYHEEEEEGGGGGKRRKMVEEEEEREVENRILKAKRDTPMSRDRERSLRGSHTMRASMNARLEESEDEAEEGEASEPETEEEPDDAEDLSEAEADEEEEEEEEAAAPEEEAEEEEEVTRSTDSERDDRSRSRRKDKYEAKGKGRVKRKRPEEEERRPASRRRVVSDDESE